MPNYVTNIFLETDYPNKLEKFIFNKLNEVDFNVLISMPESLLVSSGCDSSVKDLLQKYTQFKDIAIKSSTLENYIKSINESLNYQIPILKDQEGFNKFSKELRDTIENVYSVWNAIKYDESSWYTWRIKNWGCKWNADTIEFNFIKKGYAFKTAWNTPRYWLKELAKKVEFVLLYADENAGSNCGIIVSKEGITYEFNDVYDQDTSTVFACAVNGYAIYKDDNYYYSDREKDYDKYLYDNRIEFIERFFIQNSCRDIFNRNKDKLLKLVG